MFFVVGLPDEQDLYEHRKSNVAALNTHILPECGPYGPNGDVTSE